MVMNIFPIDLSQEKIIVSHNILNIEYFRIFYKFTIRDCNYFSFTKKIDIHP